MGDWLPQLVILGGMFALAFWMWPRAADALPVHWGIDGTPDRYGGKFEGLFLLPIVALAMYLIMLLAPRIDPRRNHYAEFWGAYTILRTSLVAFMASVYALVLLTIAGNPVDMTAAISVLTGALLAIIGWLMPRMRPTWFVGIRTPWTLTSDQAWDRTHRLGGWLFVAAGAFMAVSGLVHRPELLVAAFAFLMAVVVGLIAYSYWVWSSDANRRREA